MVRISDERPASGSGLDPARAEEFGARNDIEGQLHGIVTLERIVARAEMAADSGAFRS